MGYEPEVSFTAQLQSILRIANDLKEATLSNSLNHSPASPPIVIDPIIIPSPRSLLPSLLEAGIRPEVASVANQIYQRRAEHLKQRIQESITAASRTAAEYPENTSALPSDLFAKRITAIFTDAYHARLKVWKEEIIQRTRQASKRATKETSQDCHTFNQEYVPLLEHSFEENPFPTRADKMFLAKKSNMQYKQIHVWFQNRRNRAKKDDKPLRKRPMHERTPRPLYEHTKSPMTEANFQVSKPFKMDSSRGTSNVEIAMNDISKDIFTSFPPPHAFPSTYPPTCNYDPFPCKSGYTYFSRLERRCTLVEKQLLHLTISIDELTEQFSNLNVRDEARSKGSPKLQLQAAVAAITTIPSRAPHPSLISCEYIYTRPPSTLQAFPIVRAPISSSQVFPVPSPVAKPITLAPLSFSHEDKPSGNRKTAPLPRRFPSQLQDTCRHTTSESPSISPISPHLSSLDPQSRSCSFSSIDSLPTPPDIAHIYELPRSPCYLSSSSPIHFPNLGDMATIIPSPVS